MAVLNQLDIHVEEESSLAYAQAAQNKSLLKVVEEDVRQARAMLAVQPVVSSQKLRNVDFLKDWSEFQINLGESLQRVN